MTRKERAARIEQCARALIAAIDRNLDTKPYPVKYGVPFGEALDLRLSLEGKTRGEQNKAAKVGT